MILWVLEDRSLDNGNVFTDIAFIGSSREQAIEFMKRNADYGGNRDGYRWWWALYDMPLDDFEITFPNEVSFFVADAVQIDNQPILGKNDGNLTD